MTTRRLATEAQAIKQLQGAVRDLQAKAGRIGTRPAGALGFVEVDTNQTGITTETDLTGLQVTVDVPSGRRIRIVGSGTVRASSGTALVRGGIYGGGSLLNRWVDTPGELGSGGTFRGEASTVEEPAGGARTYKLTLESTSGTGVADLVASSSLKAFLLVEDLGPV